MSYSVNIIQDYSIDIKLPDHQLMTNYYIIPSISTQIDTSDVDYLDAGC